MGLRNGFEQLGEHELPEHEARGIWLRHVGSGAEIYHVVTDDSENLFSFAFKTLPTDSTGVAHILEHAVLCGSQRFPVKDPFILLVKGSLSTFVNAFTYPDKTVYPASSTVERDLFNLMEVYADAVFHPLLREAFFQQEGHRLQFAGDRLELTGIVYNEMKGNYSNHDSIVAEWAARSLMPDTPYGFDSGGDPAEIPNLTYQQFVDFHARYYHPSNCRIFLYGDIPTERYLEQLEPLLSGFTSTNPPAGVTPQPRWTEPRRMTVTCPADDEEAPTSVTLNWLLESVTNPDALIAFQLLEEVLLGTSAAPLRKALIDSGRGEDLCAASGVSTELYNLTFSAGLRGVTGEPADIEPLVLEALERVAVDRIDPDIVEGGLRTVDFRNREIKGGAPNGLRLMGRALRGWLHGSTPDLTLRFEEPFGKLREAARPGSGYFERLVRDSLLGNPHRSTVTVLPDKDQAARERSQLQERLAGIEANLTAPERQKIRDDQEALSALQAPDPPEAVATLPFLHKGDLPTELENIPVDEHRIDDVSVYTHDVYTNGIVYLDLVFDLSGLEPDLLRYVPMFSGVIGEMGLPGISYDAVATRLALTTGGFGGFPEAVLPLHEATVAERRVVFRLKTLESTVGEAVNLLTRLLLEASLDNTDRLRDLLKEARSDMSSSVLPSGSSYAALRAARRFSSAAFYDEGWRGASQLLFLNSSRDEKAFSDALVRTRSQVLRRGNLIVNVTAEENRRAAWEPHVRRLVAALPAGGFGTETGIPETADIPRTEALVVSSDVSYVAMALPASRLGAPEHVHEQVLAHILRTGHLWESIRMKGGAYGANASAHGLDGVFGFTSYRDPRIAETLAAYRSALEEIAARPVPADELELAIIGVTGHHIRPLSPGRKGLVSLRRVLYGITDELRAINHETLLSTTSQQVSAAADRLRQSVAESSVAVVAGRVALEAAADSVPDLVTNQVRLPT